MPSPSSSYRLSAAGYYADCLIVPMVMVTVLVWLFAWHNVNVLPFVLATLAGGLLWSLAEYAIHRWVLHAVQPLKYQHHLHHVAPPDYIGASSFVTWAVFGVLGVGLPLLFGVSIGIGLLVGLLAWYEAYIVLHDIFHHHADRIAPGSWLGVLKKNHDYHHRRSKVNFGVSSPLWDFIFDSYASPVVPRRAAPGD